MQKPLNPKRLENITLYYLERFDACSGKVRQMLNKRVQKQKMLGMEVDKNIHNWIEQTIHKMQQLGYLNDERYTQNSIRRLSEQGKSSRYIRQKLATEGISQTLISTYLSPDDELDRAIKMVHKKHLQHTEKDLAKLARAGFTYETAKKALTQGEENV